jgi:hypothetical protein
MRWPLRPTSPAPRPVDWGCRPPTPGSADLAELWPGASCQSGRPHRPRWGQRRSGDLCRTVARQVGPPIRRQHGSHRVAPLAAATGASVAPADTPTEPKFNEADRGRYRTHSVAADRRSASTSMSDMNRWSFSSEGAGRSSKKVPSPAPESTSATRRLWGLSRLLPFPWAK